MRIRQTQTIPWKPLSKKHVAYIRRALNSKMSVGEGSVRSAKTIANCITGAILIEASKDKIHLASGSSSANAKLNIGDCNGFGLEHLFRGRCKWGKYKGNEALFVYPNPCRLPTGDNEKIIMFAGGGQRDSYKKILGSSIGVWIATEINEHYDSDDSRESFLKVAFSRQVASADPRVLWDLNPCDPNNRIYRDYIDKYKTDYVGGYNYEHFTLYDNTAITAERLREIESQYRVGSVWYRRDILGERCSAQGLVYQGFADECEKLIVSSYNVNGLSKANIGVDFGGNGSATTFVCTGFFNGLQKVIPLFSKKLEGVYNTEKIVDEFSLFVEKCYSVIKKPFNVYCDSAEQVIINTLKTAVMRNNMPVFIKNARKNAINERIRLINKLHAQGRFFVGDEAVTVKNAMCLAVWDLKNPDERLDNGTTDIDTLDALEYSIEPEMLNLSRM